MKIAFIVSLLVIGCYANVITWANKPSFCKDHDCPKYTVISSNDKYELRSYETSYWVTSPMKASNYWQDRIATTQVFWKLFGYITGKNVEETKMPMTAPVLNYHMKDQVTMAFMIPFSLYNKAPAPTDSSVRLYTSPAMQVYVKAYSGEGWNPADVQSAMLTEFRADLAADNIDISDDTFYVAGYDGPTVKHFDRHHEIWIAKP